MSDVAMVVEAYLEQTGLTLRGMANALTESVKIDVSHESVHGWRRGSSEPRTDFLLQVLIAYSDWRQDFALACLQAKLPEVFIDHRDVLIRSLEG